MAIAEKVKEAANMEQNNFANDPRFTALKEFYEQMKREGIAIKRGYNLPLLDTIGRGIYSTLGLRTRR